LKQRTKREDFKDDYDSLLRFISYYYQIDIIRNINPKTMLEIGIGNKTTSNYLRQNTDIKIKTCDLHNDLKPDFIGDIRNTKIKEKFDLVCAFEVMEHLPFSEFDNCLKEITRLSKKNVVISLPHSCGSFEFILKFPGLGLFKKPPFFDIHLDFPYFYKEIKTGEHYWEIGLKNYSLKKIRKHIEKFFIIKREFRPVLNNRHKFFILKIKSGV
jgi:hypothetical protein